MNLPARSYLQSSLHRCSIPLGAQTRLRSPCSQWVRPRFRDGAGSGRCTLSRRTGAISRWLACPSLCFSSPLSTSIVKSQIRMYREDLDWKWSDSFGESYLVANFIRNIYNLGWWLPKHPILSNRVALTWFVSRLEARHTTVGESCTLYISLITE